MDMVRGLGDVGPYVHVGWPSAQDRLSTARLLPVHCLLDVTSLIHRRDRVGSSVPSLPTQHS